MILKWNVFIFYLKNIYFQFKKMFVFLKASVVFICVALAKVDV